jgi:hypothetical protein
VGPLGAKEMVVYFQLFLKFKHVHDFQLVTKIQSYDDLLPPMAVSMCSSSHLDKQLSSLSIYQIAHEMVKALLMKVVKELLVHFAHEILYHIGYVLGAHTSYYHKAYFFFFVLCIPQVTMVIIDNKLITHYKHMGVVVHTYKKGFDYIIMFGMQWLEKGYSNFMSQMLHTI